jgi:hypothetical protein
LSPTPNILSARRHVSNCQYRTRAL